MGRQYKEEEGLFMSSYPNVLNRNVPENKSEYSDHAASENADKNSMQKNEVQVVDITRQQWFWDQAVLS